MEMTLSQNGVNLIKSFEALRLTAYQDSGGVWTIGYGAIGPGIQRGTTWTRAKADQRFVEDLKSHSGWFKRYIRVPLNQNQYDALASFNFNLGSDILKGTILLAKLNSKDYKGASEEFKKFNHDGGKTVPGLTTRRAREALLFNTVSNLVKPAPKPTQNNPTNPVKNNTPSIASNTESAQMKAKIASDRLIKANALKFANALKMAKLTKDPEAIKAAEAAVHEIRVNPNIPNGQITESNTKIGRFVMSGGMVLFATLVGLTFLSGDINITGLE